jgi:hypothetical protein
MSDGGGKEYLSSLYIRKFVIEPKKLVAEIVEVSS